MIEGAVQHVIDTARERAFPSPNLTAEFRKSSNEVVDVWLDAIDKSPPDLF